MWNSIPRHLRKWWGPRGSIRLSALATHQRVRREAFCDRTKQQSMLGRSTVIRRHDTTWSVANFSGAWLAIHCDRSTLAAAVDVCAAHCCFPHWRVYSQWSPREEALPLCSAIGVSQLCDGHVERFSILRCAREYPGCCRRWPDPATVRKWFIGFVLGTARNLQGTSVCGHYRAAAQLFSTNRLCGSVRGVSARECPSNTDVFPSSGRVSCHHCVLGSVAFYRNLGSMQCIARRGCCVSGLLPTVVPERATCADEGSRGFYGFGAWSVVDKAAGASGAPRLLFLMLGPHVSNTALPPLPSERPFRPHDVLGCHAGGESNRAVVYQGMDDTLAVRQRRARLLEM